MEKNNARQGSLFLDKNGKNKLPKEKHVQVLRGLAIKILNSGLTETEIIDGEKVHFTYRLAKLMASLVHDYEEIISQMMRKGYLVVRTKDPEPESYYVCATLKEGIALKMKLAA
jgi:hypothetical protein